MMQKWFLSRGCGLLSDVPQDPQKYRVTLILSQSR
jgi:hypothetical protein